ncbi:hypothetical protein GXW74_14105 [Roseomonas eburnea]|uniref:Argininosuccinate lyase n=1 Tax=Neoroseomonas eburnea TaxID=1346889 RepID=A0A9X9XD40_9PROT|nr:hypothetical protein [Neoroseomonas eburnea]MBR0681626.1 hypothetical protein [Neoroseomonas eburnea]
MERRIPLPGTRCCLLIAAALLAGCGSAAGPSETAQDRPVSIRVGGSLAVTGAAVSQSRGQSGTPR